MLKLSKKFRRFFYNHTFNFIDVIVSTFLIKVFNLKLAGSFPIWLILFLFFVINLKYSVIKLKVSKSYKGTLTRMFYFELDQQKSLSLNSPWVIPFKSFFIVRTITKKTSLDVKWLF